MIRTEACEWFLEHGHAKSVAEAIELGSSLPFIHVHADHVFGHNKKFYRFLRDGGACGRMALPSAVPPPTATTVTAADIATLSSVSSPPEPISYATSSATNTITHSSSPSETDSALVSSYSFPGDTSPSPTSSVCSSSCALPPSPSSSASRPEIYADSVFPKMEDLSRLRQRISDFESWSLLSSAFHRRWNGYLYQLQRWVFVFSVCGLVAVVALGSFYWGQLDKVSGPWITLVLCTGVGIAACYFSWDVRRLYKTQSKQIISGASLLCSSPPKPHEGANGTRLEERPASSGRIGRTHNAHRLQELRASLEKEEPRLKGEPCAGRNLYILKRAFHAKENRLA